MIVQITVRLPEKLKRKVEELAQEKEISMNREIVEILWEKVKSV